MSGGAVSFLLGKMGSMLEKEASLVQGVEKEINELRLELESIQAFLKDAERKKNSSEGMRTWVMQLREIAHEAEDIIDEYMYRKAKRHSGGIKSYLNRTVNLPRSICYRHQTAVQLQETKAKVISLSERARRYGLDRIEQGANSNEETGLRLAESSPCAEDDVVGIEENTDLLIRWLTDSDQERKVYSVVGMGGLGKTTLVANVYSNQEVKKHFHCHAWITVSQSYKVEELVRSMLKGFYQPIVLDGIGEMNHALLVEMLREFLQGKRYVVVFDDVWDIDVWNFANTMLPNNSYGSRVIITTRKENVASCIGVGNHMVPLKPLHEDAAWNLFCRKAFWRNLDRMCPKGLEKSSQLIVRKCKGLPLALVVVGGLMSFREQTELEWSKIVDSLSWELSNVQRMQNVLLLSYNDLPFHLKNCFLYCSLFPEDYLIRQKRLVRLLVAEGFVEERGNLAMEDVAETYIKELILRSMIQPVRSHEFKIANTYQMHDLMRDLAISVAKEENFGVVHNKKETNTDVRPRRMMIHDSSENIPLRGNMSRLRSFIVFVKDMISPCSLTRILSDSQLLRVLDLQGSHIESVPEELGNLINLHYLSLRNTNVKVLPKSLGRLRNLQTLDLRYSKVKNLQDCVEKMIKLRHLLVYCTFLGMKAPIGICKIESLQTFSGVDASDELVRQIGKLNQLRRFEILNVKKDHWNNLFSSIQNMKSLEMLGVAADNDAEILDLEGLPSPPACLYIVFLRAHLKKLPDWMGRLEHLHYLYLHKTQLRTDLLSSIQVLPSLGYLQLYEAFNGQKLCFTDGSFPALRRLYLRHLTELKCVEIDKGAMPCIQELYFEYCCELKIVPEGIQFLTCLQKLQVQNMREEFMEKLRGDGSTVCQCVQHIPIITHIYEREGKTLFESLN